MPKNVSEKLDIKHNNSLGSEISTPLLGSWNTLNIAMNMDDFDKWLWNNYKMKASDVFEGYKILLDSALNTFFFFLATDQSLGLSEDFVFYRARFSGIPLNKFPSTCEKSHLIKNVDRFRRKIINAKTPEDLKKAVELFRKNVLEIFGKIYEKYVEPNKGISSSKSELLIYATMDTVFTFLDELRRGHPQGILINPFDDRYSGFFMNPRFLEIWENEGLKGYAYALQYVWNTLLGDDIEKTALVNMHNVKSISELDEYFDIIEKEIINPLESKIGDFLGSITLFFTSSTVPKSLFGKLLEKPSNPKLTTSEYLDYLLLWYSVEVIDSSNGLIFNSSPTILSLFIGNIQIRRKYEIEDKLRIIKFVHENNLGRDYSYGILIESSGSFADYSGWLIFFDCCGDYSGFSYSLYSWIEHHLEEYRDYVEIIEYKISKEKFRKYLMDKSSLKSKLELWKELNTRPSFEKMAVGDIKGSVVELLAFYMESFKKPNTKVLWRQKINGEEYDILVEGKEDIRIIECKTELGNYNLKSEIEKLKKKIKKYPSKKRKIGFFYTWYPIRSEYIEMLKMENIGYRVLSEEIKINRAFKNVKLKDIIQFFDYEKIEKIDKEMLKRLQKYIIGEDWENGENLQGGNHNVGK